jgi:hypothetical protein
MVARDRTSLKVTRCKHTKERVYKKIDLLKQKSTTNLSSEGRLRLNHKKILPVDVDYYRVLNLSLRDEMIVLFVGLYNYSVTKTFKMLP